MQSSSMLQPATPLPAFSSCRPSRLFTTVMLALGSSDSLHVPRVGLVLQGLHGHKVAQLYETLMAHTHVYGCGHSLADDNKRHGACFLINRRLGRTTVSSSALPHTLCNTSRTDTLGRGYGRWHGSSVLAHCTWYMPSL